MSSLIVLPGVGFTLGPWLGSLGGLSVQVGSPDPLGAVYTVDSVNALQA